MSPAVPHRKPSTRPALRVVARLAERALAVVGLFAIVYAGAFELTIVTSPSMAPTIQGASFECGDWVLSERVSYWFRKPRRWEVVTFQTPEGVRVMKRVVGLPRESISLRGHDVYINGEKKPLPPRMAGVTYYPYGNLAAHRTVNCSEGYYILGDNSRDSEDSRFEGTLDSARIRGRATCIVWPLSRLTWLGDL